MNNEKTQNVGSASEAAAPRFQVGDRVHVEPYGQPVSKSYEAIVVPPLWYAAGEPLTVVPFDSTHKARRGEVRLPNPKTVTLVARATRIRWNRKRRLTLR